MSSVDPTVAWVLAAVGERARKLVDTEPDDWNMTQAVEQAIAELDDWLYAHAYSAYLDIAHEKEK